MKGLPLVGALMTISVLTGCSTLPIVFMSKDPLSPAEHVTLGDSYLARGEKAAAIQQYQAALNQDPHQGAALTSLGSIAYDSGDWKKARQYFTRAYKRAPHDPSALNNLAMVDAAEGKDLDRARTMLAQAIPSAGAAAPYLWDTLARVEIAAHHHKEAQYALDKASASAPRGNPEFFRHLHETKSELTP
jgi:Flp pilus assembly protein TadD